MENSGKILDTGLKYGFGYLAVGSIVGGFKNMNNNAGNHYAGPVQMMESYNQQKAGGDAYIYANGPKMGQGTCTDSQGCSNGNCGSDAEYNGNTCDEEWVCVNAPGCSSCNSFLVDRYSIYPGDPVVPF